MTTPPLRWVAATGNAHKLAELQQLIQPLGVELLSQRQFGCADAPEPHASFVENALAKARHAAAHTGLPALADDSGLCVNALGGAPGVRSARYAGEQASDQANRDLLLAELGSCPEREAIFVAALVWLPHPEHPTPLIAQGLWHGRISQEERGEHGFGYDSVFELAYMALTAAQLQPRHKNQISHRALAMRELLRQYELYFNPLGKR